MPTQDNERSYKVLIASAEDFMRPKCKVKPGDRIYRKFKSMTVPDRLEVMEVIPAAEGYTLRCRYMYHGIGPQERFYSDSILKSEDWVIEKKGVDF